MRQSCATGFYETNVASVRANFSEWRNHEIVVGPVPDTLPLVAAAEVAYLHLDMNNAIPEIAALEHFWDRLVSGAVVLMDDFAFKAHETQRRGLADFASAMKVSIASLPTGQGLLLKPRN